MSREAIKLALEALQTLHDENMDYLTRNKLGGENNQCMVFAREAITALREALAKPDFWEGYEPEPVKPAQCKYPKCSYPCTDLPDCRDAEQPAQQEPVAYIHRQGNHYEVSERFLSDDEKSRGWTEEPLYTSPPAQRTWVDLTDEERKLVRNSVGYNQFVTAGEYAEHVQKATEFKLKEKNT
jgi:hypothetical protein